MYFVNVQTMGPGAKLDEWLIYWILDFPYVKLLSKTTAIMKSEFAQDISATIQ